MHILLLVQASTALLGLGANARGVDEIQRPGGVVRRSPFRGPLRFPFTRGNGTYPASNSTGVTGPTTGPTWSPAGNDSSTTATTYWVSQPTATAPQTDCPVQFVTSTTTVGVTVIVTGMLNSTTTTTTTTTNTSPSGTGTRASSGPPYSNCTTATTYWSATGTGTGTGVIIVSTTTESSSTAWPGNVTTRGQWATTNSTTQTTTSTSTEGTHDATTTTATVSTDDEETTSCPPEDHTSTTESTTDLTTVTTQTATVSSSTVIITSSNTTTTTTTPSTTPSETATTTTTTATTTTQVIDTTGVTPVTTASSTTTQTDATPPTATVGGGDAPTGAPKPRNQYCGVHGLPVGSYFLAQFVENKAGVPVTLEGCYQFCKANFEAVGGCRAYDFHLEPGLGVPRCSLYGSDVASALSTVDNNQPHWWFDAGCGSPLDPRWRAGHAGVNDHHVDAFSIWRRRRRGGLVPGVYLAN